MAKAKTGYVGNEISKNMNTLENSQENCSN